MITPHPQLDSLATNSRSHHSATLRRRKTAVQKGRFLRPIFKTLALAMIALSVTQTTQAAIVINTNQQAGAGTLPVSNSDLINAGQATLGASSFVDTSTGLPVTALYGSSFTKLNDGLTSTSLSAADYALGPNAWSATFDLNVSTNTLGYNITSISSFASWNDNRANQEFDIYYSVVGSSSYTYLTSASYMPEPNTATSTSIVISDGASGFIAVNVDSLRFDFKKAPSETAFAEVDVAGIAVVPEPATYAMVAAGLALLTIFRRRKLA